MERKRYVRSHSFRESYYLGEDQRIVEGMQCPIDLTPLISNGSKSHSCLACGAPYPLNASVELIKEYASKYVRGLQKKLIVTGQDIKVKQILHTIRIIEVAKKHGLISKLEDPA